MPRDAELLDAVLDATASLVAVTDVHGRLVRWNRACEELMGYAAEELATGEGLFRLVEEEDRPRAQAVLDSLSARESPDGVVSTRC